MSYKPRLQAKFEEEIIHKLQEKMGYDNVMRIPRIEKISISVGLGNAKEEPAQIENCIKDIQTITGQKAVVSRAKKAISNFKIRKGDPVGVRVTLRKGMMYDFFDRLINVAIPRIRDFNGMSNKSFDGNGNFTFGLKEQIIFPEIDYDKVDRIRGMNITITTTAETDQEAFELLAAFGFPFKKAPAKREG
jgi:large subunit ribosomal protein L5